MRELQSYAGELVLGYGEPGISGEQVAGFWEQRAAEAEQEPLKDITLYCSKGYQTVENPEFGRTTAAAVTEVSGNMNPIFPNRLRKGSLVSVYDEKGCVLSEMLAEELFSSHEVIGKSVIVQGQEYVVRGLIGVSGKIAMIQGKKEDSYSNIWISYADMSASAAEQELYQILPQNAQVKSEGDLYVGIGRFFLMVPALLLFLLSVINVRRWCRKKIKNVWIRELCGGLFFLAAALGGYLIISRGLYITDDYLPPSWEDFSFWGELAAEKAGDVKGFFSSGLEYRDRLMLLLLAGTGICGLLEIVGIFCIFKFLRNLYLSRRKNML